MILNSALKSQIQVYFQARAQAQPALEPAYFSFELSGLQVYFLAITTWDSERGLTTAMPKYQCGYSMNTLYLDMSLLRIFSFKSLEDLPKISFQQNFDEKVT